MKTKKGARRAVKAEEQKVATTLGGKRTFNSGAGSDKGDGRVPQRYKVRGGAVRESGGYAFRIENKMTSSLGGYRLNVKDWKIVRQTAAQYGEVPIFVVRMPRMLVGYLRLVVVPYDFARVLMDVDRKTVSTSGKRSFKLSDEVWSLCTNDLTDNEVPHVRIHIGDGDRVFDLVVMEWDWFVHLTKYEEVE